MTHLNIMPEKVRNETIKTFSTDGCTLALGVEELPTLTPDEGQTQTSGTLVIWNLKR